MCCADAAFHTQWKMSVFYRESDPSVQFRWWESGTCSRKTHCCPAKRALSKPFLQKPFWDQEHWQACSRWESRIELTPVQCNTELSLKTDLKMIHNWCDLQNVQPRWTCLILNVAFCQQGSIPRQTGSCSWRQEVRLINVHWRGLSSWMPDAGKGPFYGKSDEQGHIIQCGCDSVGKEEGKKGEDS